MVVSKRERMMVLATGAAVLIWALDSLVLTPYLDKRHRIDDGRTDVIQKLADAETTFERQRRLRPIWAELQKGGLKLNPSQAESQALQAILDWAKAAGVDLPVLKPERSATEGQFQVISFSVTGNGSLSAISRLLWSLETATIPVRVNDMQITPRREGTDELTVRLSVSALCMPPAAPAATPAAAPAGSGSSDSSNTGAHT